ncbi:DUF6243 family protein [Streptomyces sp. ME02-8801-2C]|uniref:DUF6243 family protein n=1 Tax=Streptomyces sp. ME02-8801-2C TaxID=3028680 RepID=UPI00299FC54C|nr:DUF6243 family protein [Streptomyces sp. ME02-8801-2C]MDX3453622.1 DUF6243 family protein [Streptomyces sp. ME02-8801-2C]
MARGGGNMLGVGGTRSNLGKGALRGGGRGKQVGGGTDPQAQKRELLRKLQQKRTEEEATEAGSGEAGGAEVKGTKATGAEDGA